MLTDRLQQIKIEIEQKVNISSPEKRLLEMLTIKDNLEEKIILALQDDNLEGLIDRYTMIIKPGGIECGSCGRSLVMGFACPQDNCQHKPEKTEGGTIK